MTSRLIRADSDAQDWELCLTLTILALFLLLCR